MEWVVVVSALALMQYTWMGFRVGAMRSRHNVSAPATSGPAEFDRMFRVQQNTMEQLLIMLPAMWMFAWQVSPPWAAVLGVVFIGGRFVYMFAYLKEPSGRGLGMTIGFAASAVLLLGSLLSALGDVF